MGEKKNTSVPLQMVTAIELVSGLNLKALTLGGIVTETRATQDVDVAVDDARQHAHDVWADWRDQIAEWVQDPGTELAMVDAILVAGFIQAVTNENVTAVLDENTGS